MKLLRTLAFGFGLGLLLAGCAALQIHAEDHAATKVAKGVTRVGLCAVSFCFSEVDFAMMRQGISDEERSRLWLGVASSLNETTKANMAVVRENTPTRCHTSCRPRCVPASACGYAQTCDTICN
jgi:hypothetical protein